MSLGKTIKRIRKMKNIKLKYVCGNVIEMGNYWRFEQGQISVSADTFYQIISNLNISFEEFSLYHNDFAPDKLTEWGKQMISAFQKMDTAKLKEISYLASNEFTKNQEIRYQHLYYLALIYIDSINNEAINPLWVNQIKEYLMNCEHWEYYEVSLFNNVLFWFGDIDAVLNLYKRMNQSYLRSKSLHKTPNEEIMLATNIISMCIKEKAYFKAEEINNFIQSQEIGERSMFARTLLLWCEGLINKVVLNRDEGLYQIEMSLKIMETLEMNSTLKMFERWKKSLLTNNQGYKIFN